MNIQQYFDRLEWSRLDRAGPLVLLLLILALCWKLASIFWWVLAPPQVIQPEQVVLGSKQPQVPNISNFSLFYEQGATASNSNQNIEMQLQGVMLSYPRRGSTAVIKAGEKAERYTIGQTIADSGYVLSDVAWDHVVLKQSDGSTRKLEFSHMKLYQPEPGQDQDDASSEQVPAQTGSSQTSSSQNALGQAIDQMSEDQEQYLKQIGVNKGNGPGYEVTDQTPAALRNKLGLQAGDRILSLNGKAVGQGQSDVQLLEQAKREGKIQIEVKRGDRTMTFEQEL